MNFTPDVLELNASYELQYADLQDKTNVRMHK